MWRKPVHVLLKYRKPVLAQASCVYVTLLATQQTTYKKGGVSEFGGFGKFVN